MSTFVFPLLVKALLAEASLYSMTAADLGAARAVDKLLSSDKWDYDPEEHWMSEQSRWNDVISAETLSVRLKEGWKEFESAPPESNH